MSAAYSPGAVPWAPDASSGVPGPIGELLLPYDATRLRQTVQRRRRRLVARLISLGISLLILGGIYAVQHRAIAAQGGAYWVFTGIVWGIFSVPLVVTLLGFLRSRKELRTVPQGVAVRMGRPGVIVAEVFARWPDVAALEVVPGGLGRAERLRLRTLQGRASLVPLDQVEVHPATLDSTARTYSGGRQGVDLSRLDH